MPHTYTQPHLVKPDLPHMCAWCKDTRECHHHVLDALSDMRKILAKYERTLDGMEQVLKAILRRPDTPPDTSIYTHSDHVVS